MFMSIHVHTCTHTHTCTYTHTHTHMHTQVTLQMVPPVLASSYYTPEEMVKFKKSKKVRKKQKFRPDDLLPLAEEPSRNLGSRCVFCVVCLSHKGNSSKNGCVLREVCGENGAFLSPG